MLPSIDQPPATSVYDETKWRIQFHTYLNKDGAVDDVGHSFVSIVNDGQIVSSAGMWPSDDYMGSAWTSVSTVDGRIRSEMPSLYQHADDYNAETGQSTARDAERLKTDNFPASQAEVARLMAHIDREYDKNGNGQQYNMYGSSRPGGPHNCSTWALNALKVAFTPTTGQPTQAQQQKLQRIHNYQPSAWTITRPSKIYDNIEGLGLDDPHKLRQKVNVPRNLNDDQPFNVSPFDIEGENEKAKALQILITQGKQDLGLQDTQPGKFFKTRTTEIERQKIRAEAQRRRIEEAMRKQQRREEIQKLKNREGQETPTPSRRKSATDIQPIKGQGTVDDSAKPKRRKSTTDIKPIKPKSTDIDLH